MPRNDAQYLTIPCSLCGGAGFFGSGPISWNCPDCDGAGEIATETRESDLTADELDELLRAEDLAIAAMNEPTSVIMANLAASMAALNTRTERRAA